MLSCCWPVNTTTTSTIIAKHSLWGTGQAYSDSGKLGEFNKSRVCVCMCVNFYQRVSIASYASAGIARGGMSVRPSVCPSVTLRHCIKTKKATVMISSPSKSLNILVSRNIWIITKFERGHPERGRFMRLGWIKIGNFDGFSTNKPPYL